MRNHVLGGLALSVNIVVVLAASGCLTCVWADWPVIETVDSGGNVGEDTSLALDSQGFTHISYFAASNQYLKYASNTPELPPSVLLETWPKSGVVERWDK